MKSIALLFLVCLATSCSKHKPRTAAAAPAAAPKPGADYCLPASSTWAEDDYTQWMTRAELAFFQEKTSADQYFSHVEGRNNGGLNEYRAVRKPFPADQYEKCVVWWALNGQELFDREMALLREGFVRKSMQVFVDASCTSMHQIVWLKPIGVAETRSNNEANEQKPAPANPRDADAANLTAGAEPTPSAPDGRPETTAPDDVSPTEKKPPLAVVVAPAERTGNPVAERANSQKFTIHTVVKGDVLEKIARRYHTSTEAILKASNLKNDNLHIGQKLTIPRK